MQNFLCDTLCIEIEGEAMALFGLASDDSERQLLTPEEMLQRKIRTNSIYDDYCRFRNLADTLVTKWFKDVPCEIVRSSTSSGGQISAPQSEEGISVRIFVPGFSTYRKMNKFDAEVGLIGTAAHERYHVYQFQKLFNGPATPRAELQLYSYLATTSNTKIYHGYRRGHPMENYYHNPFEVAAEISAVNVTEKVLKELHPTFGEKRIHRMILDDVNLQLQREDKDAFFKPQKGDKFKSWDELKRAMQVAEHQSARLPLNFSKKKCALAEPITDFLSEHGHEIYAYTLEHEKSGRRMYKQLASIVVEERPELIQHYSLLASCPLSIENSFMGSPAYKEYMDRHIENYPYVSLDFDFGENGVSPSSDLGSVSLW